MILTVMAVAGLPIIVCVSQAHGAAIEFRNFHVDHQDSSQDHRTLFGVPVDALDSGSCSDFRLDRGILGNQSRLKQSIGLLGSDNNVPAVAALALRFPSPHFAVSEATSWVDCPVVRSSLSDLSTIVLLI
jgi:hypothetical protein